MSLCGRCTDSQESVRIETLVPPGASALWPRCTDSQESVRIETRMRSLSIPMR